MGVFLRNLRSASAFLALGALLVSARDSSAKARTIYSEQTNVEAVIYHVDTSDNPGDTDMNILLRPPTPDQAEVWWDRFWPYMDQEWTDDILVDVTKTSTYGAACQACAGTGAQGTACKVQEGVSYVRHPCPRLFSCAACLDDMARTGRRTYHDPMLGYKFDKADLTVKAEIFVNDRGGVWNDSNGTFEKMKHDLGFPNGSCDEGHTGTHCGKRVWVSGWIATDNAHDNRPELHPVSSILVDQGLSGSGARRLRAGTFIDGSTDSSFQYVLWMANYHELVPMARQWRFDTSTDPFTKLFRPRPPNATPITEVTTLGSSALKGFKVDWSVDKTCASPLESQIYKLDDQIAAIDGEIKELQEQRDHLGAENQGNVNKSAIAAEIMKLSNQKAPLVTQRNALRAKLAACGSSQYRYAEATMDWEEVGGSYWAGEIKLDWQQPQRVQLDVKPFGHAPGYMWEAVMNAANLPPAPIVAVLPGVKPVSTCIVKPGTNPNALTIKHWYGWKVVADTTLDNKTATLTWKIPPGASMSPTPPSTVTGNKRIEFILWVPSPQYSGEIQVTSKTDTATVSDSEQLKNGAPRVWLDLKGTAVTLKPDGRWYSGKVSAAPNNFCGDPSTLLYTWKKDGVAMPWKGPGPFDISLKSGDKAKIEVLTTDQFKVEKAADVQVLVAPELDVDATTACATTVAVDVPAPRGFVKPAINALSTLCKETKLDATARVVSGELAFNESSAGRVVYKWDDLKIAVESDGWKWKPVPASWKVTYPDQRGVNRTLLIAPDQPTYFMFQVAVSGTDTYGRTATEYVKGDNDFTPVGDLRLVMRKLWATWRPNTPIPTEASLTTSSDPLTRRYASVLAQLSRARPEVRSLYYARRSFRQLRGFGFGVAAKERNLTYAPLLRAPTALKPTTLTNVEELNEAAHMELRLRVPQL